MSADCQGAEWQRLFELGGAVFANDPRCERLDGPIDVQVAYIGQVVGLWKTTEAVGRWSSTRVLLRHGTRSEVVDSVVRKLAPVAVTAQDNGLTAFQQVQQSLLFVRHVGPALTAVRFW